MSNDALSPVLEKLRTEPSRTWSVIITLFGDAIVPRGGSVWLGTLLTFFKALDITEGVVRTAMSRLASDGWLSRHKVGRNSFYHLAEKGRLTFSEATKHIYMSKPPTFSGSLELFLAETGSRKEAASFEGAGFGSPLPGLFVAPMGQNLPAHVDSALRLHVTGDVAQLRDLAARSWPLEATALAYERFLKMFGPMERMVASNAPVSDLDAFIGRILLIHEYRRIVLRDPILPAEVLPNDWPGQPARLLCVKVYRGLLKPSEKWLDTHAIDETGGPLPQSSEVALRFGDSDQSSD